MTPLGSSAPRTRPLSPLAMTLLRERRAVAFQLLALAPQGGLGRLKPQLAVS